MPTTAPVNASMPSDDALRESVRTLLHGNAIEGFSPLLNGHYCYIRPSKKKYWFQWFWDTCFHVFMLCDLEEAELAKHNLQSLFAMQDEDGFIGHMVFWQKILPSSWMDVLQSKLDFRHVRPHMSSLIQPSFVAQALLAIDNLAHDAAFLGAMLPKVKKYLHWLMENRDLDGDELLSIVSPFESGMDFKPSFDSVLGFRGGKANWRLFLKVILVDFRNLLRQYSLPAIKRAGIFLVKEVNVNTAYVKDLLALAELCTRVDGHDDAVRYTAHAKKVTEAMLTVMFDEDDLAFYDVVAGSNAPLKVLTPTVLFPIALPDVPQELCDRMVRRHLMEGAEFATAYPIPSVAVSEPSFFPGASRALWRGPTWIFTNWFLCTALRRRGFDEKAAELVTATKRLIALSGFREFYNPHTGEGLGERDFTWPGLVVTMME